MVSVVESTSRAIGERMPTGLGRRRAPGLSRPDRATPPAGPCRRRLTTDVAPADRTGRTTRCRRRARTTAVGDAAAGPGPAADHPPGAERRGRPWPPAWQRADRAHALDA